MSAPATVIRCVTISVSVPLGTDPDGAPWTWQTFGARLNEAFRLSTDLANWCVRRLFVLDDPLSAACPDAVKKWYGYRDASANYPRAADWAGAMTSLNLIARAVQRKYIQQRFDVMVRHDSSLLTYRFPQPYPVHNQNWSLRYESGFPVVRLNMPGLGRVDLRLKRSAEFGRQLGMIRQMYDDPDQKSTKRGEAALYRDRKGNVLLKLVGHFPRRERGPADNVAFVHTDPGALLVVEINGRPVKVTNGDHMRRESAKHKTFLRRAGEDKKREVRMDRRQRANLNTAVDSRCDKQRRRVDTAVKQVAAQVARLCQRQRVGTVAFDDANREFFPEGFPWHALKTRLEQLLKGELGCEWIDGTFTHTDSPDAAKERRAWLTTARAKYQTVPKIAAHKSRPPKKSHSAVSPLPATTRSSRVRS
jgi:hypothetical protein